VLPWPLGKVTLTPKAVGPSGITW